MKRIFVALEIPKHIQHFIGKIGHMRQFANIPLKYEKTAKIHLTLAFLGWLKQDKDLETIINLVNNISQNHSPLKLITAQLGAFPTPTRPRVIWLGLNGEIAKLQQLQKELNQQIKKRSLKYDNRPFVPHLTIGRLKIKKGKLKKQIGEKISKISLPQKSFIANTLTVFESQLFRTGSVYKKLHQQKLKQ